MSKLQTYLDSIRCYDPIAYIKSLREYEGFIMDNYPKIHAEAWHAVESRGIEQDSISAQ